MTVENGHWEWNFFNGYFSPTVVENCNGDDISVNKAKLEKYLKEKFYSEHYPQLSFKYFVRSFLIGMLLLKVL